MDTQTMVMSGIIVCFIFALFCMNLAKSKGHNELSWFAAGFFFWFIALIAAVGLPDRKKPTL